MEILIFSPEELHFKFHKLTYFFKLQIPEKNPELKFWPSDNYEFLGVPYVGLSGISWEMDHVIKKQHLI